jgi:hypothetical protein
LSATSNLDITKSRITQTHFKKWSSSLNYLKTIE